MQRIRDAQLRGPWLTTAQVAYLVLSSPAIGEFFLEPVGQVAGAGRPSMSQGSLASDVSPAF